MTLDTIEETMDKLRKKNKAFYNEKRMAEFDGQGRHRSEWCYAPYDGRKISLPPKNGGSSDDISEV